MQEKSTSFWMYDLAFFLP